MIQSIGWPIGYLQVAYQIPGWKRHYFSIFGSGTHFPNTSFWYQAPGK